jgi:hypothetical protein
MSALQLRTALPQVLLGDQLVDKLARSCEQNLKCLKTCAATRAGHCAVMFLPVLMCSTLLCLSAVSSALTASACHAEAHRSHDLPMQLVSDAL